MVNEIIVLQWCPHPWCGQAQRNLKCCCNTSCSMAGCMSGPVWWMVGGSKPAEKAHFKLSWKASWLRLRIERCRHKSHKCRMDTSDTSVSLLILLILLNISQILNIIVNVNDTAKLNGGVNDPPKPNKHMVGILLSKIQSNLKWSGAVQRISTKLLSA